jgi:hypothetical protein
MNEPTNRVRMVQGLSLVAAWAAVATLLSVAPAKHTEGMARMRSTNCHGAHTSCPDLRLR